MIFFPLKENSEINHGVQEIQGVLFAGFFLFLSLHPVGETILFKVWKAISPWKRDLVHQLSSSIKPSSKQSNNIWGLGEGSSGGSWDVD